MKRFLIPLLAVLALPSEIKAEPVYLDCKLFGEKLKGGSVELGLTLNEEQRKVSFVVKDTGATETVPAVFTPEQIVTQTDSDVITRFELNRTNGIARRSISVMGMDMGNSEGKCWKAKKKKTLF